MKENKPNPTKSAQTPIVPSLNLQYLLSKKYASSKFTYTYISINNLIFNEKCHIVSRFKEYLIWDCMTEFLRRFYAYSEAKRRLNRILTFYKTYSKIFPNYIKLPESEHLYRNIGKKQKMIDAMNAIKKEEEENLKNMALGSNAEYQSNYINFFTPKVHKSILKYQPSKINEQTMSKSSISISIMSRKYDPYLESTFAVNSNINEGNQKYIENSIEEIISELNGKKVSNIPTDCLNAMPKKLINHLPTLQTSKTINNIINNFFQIENQGKNVMSVLNGNKTSARHNNNNIIPKKQNASPSSKSNNNMTKHIKVPQLKPLNNLNIISANPQSSSLKGSTVINLNNNFYTCTEVLGKEETKLRKSLSREKSKETTKYLKKYNTNIVTHRATINDTTKSIKRETTLPLSALNLNEKFQKTIQTDRVRTTRKKETLINLIAQKSARRASKSGSKRNVLMIKDKSNNNKLSRSSKKCYINQKKSPEQSNPLITNDKYKNFKEFIERSKMISLANTRLSDSFSPNKNNTCKNSSSSSTNNNSMHRNSNQINQKNFQRVLSNQIKVINSLTNRIHSLHKPNDSKDLNQVHKIKVNTKPFLERNVSNKNVISKDSSSDLNC